MEHTLYEIVWVSGLLMSTLWPMVAVGLWYGQAYVMDNEHKCILLMVCWMYRYRDGMMRPIGVPLIHNYHLALQHNARPYVARICTQFLETENIPVLAWPEYQKTTNHSGFHNWGPEIPHQEQPARIRWNIGPNIHLLKPLLPVPTVFKHSSVISALQADVLQSLRTCLQKMQSLECQDTGKTVHFK